MLKLESVIKNNMKVALCCIGRLENSYIKEYVDFYLGIGVDKIFLYDNNYNGEEYFEDVINEYISNGSVEVVNFRNQSYCQLKAYQDCYDKHSSEYDWFCFFDIDEFIAFQNVKTIKEYRDIKVKRGYPDGNKNFFKENDWVNEFFFI